MKTAERLRDDLHELLRLHEAVSPLRVQVRGGPGRHHLGRRLARLHERLHAVPHAHEHVAVGAQVGARAHRPVAGDDPRPLAQRPSAPTETPMLPPAPASTQIPSATFSVLIWTFSKSGPCAAAGAAKATAASS